MIPSENIITNIIEYLYRSSKSVVRIITLILKQGLKINLVFKGDNFRQISKLQRNVVSLERKTFKISRLFFFGKKKTFSGRVLDLIYNIPVLKGENVKVK